MKTETFDFKFKHEGEIIKASCQVSKPFAKKQFRISALKEDGNALILVMYKVDKKDEMFFWFPVDKKKQALSKSVAKALERKFKM